ncbi:hypothetical protein LXA43DRAFT_1159819, partial [Ganoderma leucocontextum]
MALDDQPSTPTRDTPHPFDQRSADVTLRTSDSVQFHVHTLILPQASPVFATMFELPQPLAMPGSFPESSEVPLIRPVIDVAEDSKALEPLLQLCYPCAAQGPLRVWAFGCRHGLEHVARGGAEALRASLPSGEREKLSFLPDIPQSLQGLDGISAGQYFRLLQFVCYRGGLRHENAAAGRVSSPSAAGTGSTSTGATHAHRTSVEIELLRPPEVAAMPVTTRTIARQKTFGHLSFADSEDFPFLGHPLVDVHSPDIVCRCKDGTEFEAHQGILSLHSPVLKARIATLNAALEGSQPSQLEGFAEQVEELTITLPVLRLEGPSRAISTLLCICYQHLPQSKLPHSRLDCIELLAVATKYHIQPAVDLASARWKAVVHLRPRNSGMRGVTRTVSATAAPAALGWCPPLRTRLGEFSRILEDVPARTYHQLFVYVDACSRAALHAMEQATEAWELVVAQRMQTVAGQAEAEAAARMYQAVTDELNRRREALARSEVAPKANHVRAVRWSSYSSVAGPSSLRNKFKDDLKSLLESLQREIDDAINTVSLKVHTAPPYS